MSHRKTADFDCLLFFHKNAEKILSRKNDEMEAVIGLSELLDELLDSSSSSEEEIEAVLLRRNPYPRVQDFIVNVVHSYTELEFKTNFRITRGSAEYLVARYSSSRWYVKRSYKGGRLQSTAETHMLSFLWFSANKTTFREVANLFGVTLSNIHFTFNKVLSFLVEAVASESIRFPKEDVEKEAIAKEFQKIAGFPNVLGCIDGSYISIRKPKNKIRSTYTNRHDCASITLQGICDAKLRFLDVYTGIPSKIHDSRILKLSFIGKELPSACAPKYHLLGDAAYPLREYLLTPFRDYGSLSESEKLFNLKFCQTRVKIENAFGVLKSRFRQLMRLDFHDVEVMAKFIIACCALHNICIERNDCCDIETSYIETESGHIEGGDRRDLLLTQLGQLKRNEIKNHFYNFRH
ncbi:putative nuclease HARBI1 [Rhagoletis pomonella]|uniref:putative nuclease HARBI1 n=1 Tax=Rhagoletis pomonella TaxID=28610 RepID=UPI0017875D37|nr:putative nuclease HARBI1 [Rhagoletis pomonella]